MGIVRVTMACPRYRVTCVTRPGTRSEAAGAAWNAVDTASPCLGSVDVTPWRTRLDFPDCHYITVSSPSGGVGGFRSVNFNAFRTRRVRAASTDPATFRSIVHAKRHQAYRLERLHRPLRREVDPRLLKPAISDRYERASLLVTSNLPFSEWNQIFQGERMTAALLDRLTHHCQIFEMNGESYRFRESMKSKKSRKAE